MADIIGQYRFGIEQIINEDPVLAVRTVGTVVTSEVVRISHDTSSAVSSTSSPAGIASSEVLYMLVPYTSVFAKGNNVVANGVTYKLGQFSEKRVQGEVYSRTFQVTIVQ
jgi:hypothetical protein